MCVRAGVCELNIMDGRRMGGGGAGRQICVGEPLVSFCLCALQGKRPGPAKIASSAFSEWKFRMAANLC